MHCPAKMDFFRNFCKKCFFGFSHFQKSQKSIFARKKVQKIVFCHFYNWKKLELELFFCVLVHCGSLSLPFLPLLLVVTFSGSTAVRIWKILLQLLLSCCCGGTYNVNQWPLGPNLRPFLAFGSRFSY